MSTRTSGSIAGCGTSGIIDGGWCTAIRRAGTRVVARRPDETAPRIANQCSDGTRSSANAFSTTASWEKAGRPRSAAAHTSESPCSVIVIFDATRGTHGAFPAPARGVGGTFEGVALDVSLPLTEGCAEPLAVEDWVIMLRAGVPELLGVTDGEPVPDGVCEELRVRAGVPVVDGVGDSEGTGGAARTVSDAMAMLGNQAAAGAGCWAPVNAPRLRSRGKNAICGAQCPRRSHTTRSGGKGWVERRGCGGICGTDAQRVRCVQNAHIVHRQVSKPRGGGRGGVC